MSAALHSNGCLTRCRLGRASLLWLEDGFCRMWGEPTGELPGLTVALPSQQMCFPPPSQDLTAVPLGSEWICPSARILTVSVLIWVLKDKFSPRNPVFSIHTWCSYLSQEINIDYLFSSLSAGMARCPIPGRAGVVQRAGISEHCVWRNGYERWGGQWALKHRGCRKWLFFLVLSSISGSWPL